MIINPGKSPREVHKRDGNATCMFQKCRLVSFLGDTSEQGAAWMSTRSAQPFTVLLYCLLLSIIWKLILNRPCPSSWGSGHRSSLTCCCEMTLDRVNCYFAYTIPAYLLISVITNARVNPRGSKMLQTDLATSIKPCAVEGWNKPCNYKC